MQYCLFRTVVELDYNVTLACGIVWVSGVVTPSSTGSVHQRNWLSQHKTQSPLPLQSHAPSTQKLMAFRRQETEPCLRESQGRPWGHQSSITQINDWLNSKSESWDSSTKCNGVLNYCILWFPWWQQPPLKLHRTSDQIWSSVPFLVHFKKFPKLTRTWGKGSLAPRAGGDKMCPPPYIALCTSAGTVFSLA